MKVTLLAGVVAVLAVSANAAPPPKPGSKAAAPALHPAPKVAGKVAGKAAVPVPGKKKAAGKAVKTNGATLNKMYPPGPRIAYGTKAGLGNSGGGAVLPQIGNNAGPIGGNTAAVGPPGQLGTPIPLYRTALASTNTATSNVNGQGGAGGQVMSGPSNGGTSTTSSPIGGQNAQSGPAGPGGGITNLYYSPEIIYGNVGSTTGSGAGGNSANGGSSGSVGQTSTNTGNKVAGGTANSNSAATGGNGGAGPTNGPTGGLNGGQAPPQLPQLQAIPGAAPVGPAPAGPALPPPAPAPAPGVPAPPPRRRRRRAAFRD